MNHFEWNWTQEGETIYAQGWSPPQTKGVVCIVHGLSEHSTRYAPVAERLCAAGYAVLAYDEFGHGRTTGKRGHVTSYELFLDSVAIILNEAKTRFPGVKQFLWGHSMGAGIVTHYALKTQPNIAGVVAVGPPFKLSFEPPAVKVLLAKIMIHIYPAYSENANLESEAISRDRNEVRKYIEDPHNHGKITASTFLGLFNAAKWDLAHASELKIPMLLMHGTADRLTSSDGSKEFAANAPKNLVTLRLWEGFYHELHNEPEPDRSEVLAYITNWLNNHLT